MGSTSGISLVYLVCFVYLVGLVEPNNKTNQITALLEIPTAFDRLEQRHFVGILDIHPDWNPIGDTRDPGPERFQLVR